MKHYLKILKILVVLAFLGSYPSLSFANNVQEPYSFQEAVQRGVVDFIVNPWLSVDNNSLISGLSKLNPGLVNRLGFEYAGVTLKKLDFTAQTAAKVHAALPRALIGGGFPENLKADYAQTLPCDSETDLRLFSRDSLTGKPAGTENKYYWIDPSLSSAQDYYICIGKAQIRRGFNHLHFEESDNVIKQSGSRQGCIAGYKHVRDALMSYAQTLHTTVTFSGEPDLAQTVPMDAVYVPSRFFIDAFDIEYQNKVATNLGRGYTYALSSTIVKHFLGLLPPKTRIFFYVDNFDYHQDDLRRMMELDGPNRRELITRSAATAHRYGVTFIPSLNHCDGCIPINLVGDSCEILPGGKVSYYNAATCGDFDAIQSALEIQGRQ